MRQVYDYNDSTARPDKKNNLQNVPDSERKNMPELPAKDIQQEGTRESKNIASDKQFES